MSVPPAPGPALAVSVSLVSHDLASAPKRTRRRAREAEKELVRRRCVAFDPATHPVAITLGRREVVCTCPVAIVDGLDTLDEVEAPTWSPPPDEYACDVCRADTGGRAPGTVFAVWEMRPGVRVIGYLCPACAPTRGLFMGLRPADSPATRAQTRATLNRALLFGPSPPP